MGSQVVGFESPVGPVGLRVQWLGLEKGLGQGVWVRIKVWVDLRANRLGFELTTLPLY